MKPALALLTLLVLSQLSYAQDVKVRERAEHLLERANQVSSSPHLPNARAYRHVSCVYG